MYPLDYRADDSCNSASQVKLRKRLSWVMLFIAAGITVYLGWGFTQARRERDAVQAKLDFAIESTGAGFWWWKISDPKKFNPDDEVWYSADYLNLLGYTREEWPNKLGSWMSHVHLDDLKRIEASGFGVRDGVAKRWRDDMRMRAKDGSYIWLRVIGTCRLDEEGRPYEMAGAAIDIEAEVGQRQRAERIVHSSGVAMVLCNEDHKITVFNPAAEKLFGWKSDEVVGKTVDMLVGDGYLARHQEKYDAAVTAMKNTDDHWTRTTHVMRGMAVRKDGKNIPVLVYLRGIKYGKRVEFLGVIVPDNGPENQQPPQEVKKRG